MDPLIDSIVSPGISNADAAIGNAPDPLIDSIVNPASPDTGRMNFAFETGISTPPDRAARVIKAQSRTGLPQDFIEQDLDRVEMEMKKKDFNPDAFQKNSPELATWMAKNPNHAALVQDDLEPLQKLEKTVDDYGFAEFLGSDVLSGINSAASRLTKIPGFVADAVIRNKTMGLFSADDLGIQNVPAEFFDKNAKSFATPFQQIDVLKSAGEGNYSLAGKGLASQIATSAPNTLAIIAAAMVGGPAAGSIVAGGGSAAQKLEQNKARKNDEPLPEPGLTGPGTQSSSQFGNALATGAIEVAAENLPFGTLGVLKKHAKDLTARFGKGATREILTSSFLQIGKSAAQEGTEESLTSIAQDLTDYAMDINPDALDGILNRAGNNFLVGFGSGGVTTGPAVVAQARSQQKANQARDFYNALGDSAEATKLRQRLPEAQKDLIDQITKGKGVENVYVPIEAMESYFQSKNIPPAAIAQQLGIADSFNEAKESGGDVKIPLGSWTSNFVGTEHYKALQNDVKFSPENQTVNQIQAEKQEIQDALAKEEAAVKAAEDQAKADQERIQLEEGAAAVGKQFSELLEKTGKFDAKQIEQYSTLFSERYSARAENRGLGETALGLFQRQNLDLVTPQEFAPAETPMAAQTQEQESYEQARRRDQDDPRMQRARELGFDTKNIYFHGTKSDITAFDPNYRGSQNTRTGVKTEEAFYFSMPDDPETASYYAENANFEREQIEAYKKNPDIDIDELLDLGRGEVDAHPDVKKANASYSKVFRKVKKLAEKRGEKFYEVPEYEQVKAEIKKLEAVRRNVKAIDANVVPVFLKFNNPYVFDTSKPENLEFLDKLEKESPGEHHHLAALVEWAKKEGYDAIIREGSERSIAVFEPDQIRSVNAEFDLAKADSPNILDQSGQASPRGRILFGDGRNIIQLFEESDASTVLHEAGHLWLNELVVDATTEGANPNLAKDLDATLEWMGLSVRSSDGRKAVKEAIQTDQHEQWARGFEAYLMEGKAPSQALRKAFARFKLWLTRIYRNVRNLNVDLNDDVRRVFDRLLVGESVAEAADKELAFDPLFADPKAMGMNDTQAKRYEQAMAEAKIATQDRIQNRIMKDLMREQEAWYKSAREEIRKEAAAEVDASPEYRALRIMKEGLIEDGVVQVQPGEVKLSRDMFRAEYGEEILNSMPKESLAVQGEGLPSDSVAEMLGFFNSGALVKALANLPSRETFIEQLTDRRMNELYPDITTSEELSEVARGLAMGEERSKVLRMELEHLASNNLPVLKEAIRRVTKRLPTEAAVRAQAEAMINRKVLSEIRPRSYELAAAKAAREAGSLLAKGDIEGAFESKRRQLLNMELHRAAENAIEQRDKALKRFKQFRKSDEDLAKIRDTDLVNAGRAILQKYGLGRAEKTAEEYLAPMKAYDPEMYSNISDIVNGAIQNAAPYKELTFDNFMAMADVVDSIWELSKSTREMEIDGKKVDRDEVKAALSERLSEMGSDGTLPGTKAAITDGERRTMAIANLRNQITRVEHWAHTMDKGITGGAFSNFLVRPVLDSTARYRLAKTDALKTLSEAVKGLTIENPRAQIDASEIGYAFNKPELLMAMLHSGNGSNLKKLLLGRGWGDMNADGTLDTSKWDAFLERAQREGSITKSDWDFVQKIWDLNESLKPAAQKAHKKMFGFYFNEITANEVKTPFGNYKGGYMPAIADQKISMDANVRSGEKLEDSPAQMFPTTGRGFAKNREDNYSTPLSLDFSKIQSHIDKVLRFSNIEPAVKDAARLVKDRSLRAQLNTHTSEVAKDLLEPWLVRAAVQRSTTPGFSATWDSMVNWFRRTTTIQFMVANVTNAIQNTTGLFPAASRVGAANLAGSFRRYIIAPKDFAKTVKESSEYMRARMDQNSQAYLRDIDEVILQPSKFETFREWTIRGGYILDRLTNGTIELVVWGGAYNFHLEKGLTHEQAVKEADATVRQTLAAMNPEDSSKFETGTPTVRLFTMFSGFFNTQANLLQSELSIAKEEGFTTKEGALRTTRAYAYILALPAIVSAIIARAMAGEGLDEDDDGEYFDDVFSIFIDSQRRYLTAFVPGGSLLNAGFNSLNDKPFDDRISLSPALSNLERAYAATKSVPKVLQGGNVSRALKDGAAVLGLTTGLPVTPLAKPLGYWSDISEGKADPTGPVDFLRGTATGKRGDGK
jgi:hypothetical protein